MFKHITKSQDEYHIWASNKPWNKHGNTLCGSFLKMSWEERQIIHTLIFFLKNGILVPWKIFKKWALKLRFTNYSTSINIILGMIFKEWLRNDHLRNCYFLISCSRKMKQKPIWTVLYRRSRILFFFLVKSLKS